MDNPDDNDNGHSNLWDALGKLVVKNLKYSEIPEMASKMRYIDFHERRGVGGFGVTSTLGVKGQRHTVFPWVSN